MKGKADYELFFSYLWAKISCYPREKN